MSSTAKDSVLMLSAPAVCLLRYTLHVYKPTLQHALNMASYPPPPHPVKQHVPLKAHLAGNVLWEEVAELLDGCQVEGLAGGSRAATGAHRLSQSVSARTIELQRVIVVC